VGVSASTIERVKTILEEGSKEHVEQLKAGEAGKQTIYKQVKDEKLKSKLQSSAPALASTVQIHQHHDNIRLFKDFRTITLHDIADESVDLVLALSFPDSTSHEEFDLMPHQQSVCVAAYLFSLTLL
jgi:hypothetical protein